MESKKESDFNLIQLEEHFSYLFGGDKKHMGCSVGVRAGVNTRLLNIKVLF